MTSTAASAAVFYQLSYEDPKKKKFSANAEAVGSSPIDHSRKYHNIPYCSLFVTTKFFISIVFNLSWELKWPQEKQKTMHMQNFGVTNKEHYGMLWYFLEWSIIYTFFRVNLQLLKLLIHCDDHIFI